jgi:hypothetical protein
MPGPHLPPHHHLSSRRLRRRCVSPCRLPLPTDLDSLLESDPVPPHPRPPSCVVTCSSCSHDATAHAHFHATRGHDDHACATRGPFDPTCATRDPVDPACATRGPIDSACATRGPVDPGSLRQHHACLPPPRPRHYLGAPRLGPVDEHDSLRRPPPSSITAASRPHLPLSTFRRSALSRPYTTRSPSTATPDTSTRW